MTQAELELRAMPQLHFLESASGAYPTKSYIDWFTNICNYKYLRLAYFIFVLLLINILCQEKFFCKNFESLF
jgi:hypothetical protein